MTTIAWGLGLAAAVVAAVEWWAVWTGRRSVRVVTKPLTLVLLIGVALAVEPFDGAVRWWMVAGLVLSLAGDVFLLGSERWFVAGLASFLLGHVAYVVAMRSEYTSAAWLALGMVVVLAGVGAVGRKIVAALGHAGRREMVGPVVAYLVVISAMVVSAFGTAAPWAVAGALLFYASDATLAWNRFVAPRRFGPVAVMVTYHLAQAGLVGWLVTG